METILAIDDSMSNLMLVEAILKEYLPEVKLLKATSGKEGILIAEKKQPRLIILDILMPNMDGYEVCKILRQNEKTKTIPIIMLTAIEASVQNKIKGLEAGAEVFQSKPTNPKELVAQVNTLFRIKKAEDKLIINNEDLEKIIQENKKEIGESKENLKKIFDFANNGILIADKKNHIFMVNTTMCKMLGYTRKEMLDLHVVDLYDRTDKVIDEKLKTVAESKDSVIESITMIRKDRSTIIADVTAVPITLNGKSYIMVSFQDITEQKKEKEKLIESEETFKNIFNNATDAIYIQDKNGTFLDVNQGAVDMYGYTREELIGKSPEFTSAPGKNDLKMVKECIQKAYKGQPQQFEFWGKKKNGEIFPKIVRVSAVKYFGKKVISAFALDITKRNLAEKVNKESEKVHKMLYNITDAVNTTKDLKEFFGIMHKQLGTIVDTTNFYVALYNKDKNIISFDYLIDEFVDKKGNINVARKFKKGLTEYVIKTGKPLLADAKAIKKLTKAGKIDGVGTPSKIWLGVPLKIENKITGVITVQSYTDASLYTEKDLETLKFVSNTIATAIDRKIAEDAVKESEKVHKMLYNITDAVNTTKDLDELFEIIHKQLSTIVDTTNYNVALYDKKTDSISLPYQINEKDKFTSFPAGKSLASYVIKTGKPLLADEKTLDRLTKTGKVKRVGAPSKIWLGVPLKIENEIVGMISVQSYTDASLYTEKDLETLTFVS
ncbi:MAG: PAS domain S-box protein, partial [Candidatus Marinimicrobia bacterium]|nr:PAS domain S-box protein [Candidatus Neomarinimicrobiota bacterium]